MFLHKKVKRFARQMQIELNHNLHKLDGIWEWKGLEQKVADLEYHKAKMLIAMKANDKQSLKEYIADCANILMSIGDECGLYDEPTKDDKKMAVLNNCLVSRVDYRNATVSKPIYEDITRQSYVSSHY